MQLIPIRTAEVAEELDLIRGIACSHITLNIDYRTTPPTWTDSSAGSSNCTSRGHFKMYRPERSRMVAIVG
jgi:hypothetical protein